MADGNFGFKVNGFDSYTLLLGEELRGERATLGKSLLQVQKDLKIKAAYVSAIENCDLDAFPNKGFVRNQGFRHKMDFADLITLIAIEIEV